MKAIIRTGCASSSIAALMATASPGYTQTPVTDTPVTTHVRKTVAARSDISDGTLIKSLPGFSNGMQP